MDRYKGLTERLEVAIDERYCGLDGAKDFIQKDLDLVNELINIVKLDIEFNLLVKEIERNEDPIKIIRLEYELELIGNKQMELFKSMIGKEEL